jgi:hypothetical protein
MNSIFRRINIGLLTLLAIQFFFYFSAPTVQAQTAKFLKRPYYGGSAGVSAYFDHHCPDYDGACSQSTGTFYKYLYTYPDPDALLNGIGRMLKYDGNNNVSNCANANYCYSGHSGYDFPIAYVPVVAAAAGTVVNAGWSDPNHDASYGLYIDIDHGNNHRTRYGHLSMVRYTAGNTVGNFQIGTAGATGNVTGPHLHFEVLYYLNSVWKMKDPYGWSGSNGDPWQTWSGVTSEWLWLDEPARTQTPPTYNGDYTLDNDDTTYPSNFQLSCNAGTGTVNCPNWAFATTSNSGLYDDLRYKNTPNGTTANYTAKWSAPDLPSTGQYEVEVWIPKWNPSNRSDSARYTVCHNAGCIVVVVNQRAVNREKDSNGNFIYNATAWGAWISLGRYNFNAGSSGYVNLTDAAYIGSDVDNTRRILADGVRWRKTH